MKKLLVLFVILSVNSLFSQCYSSIESKVFHNISLRQDGTMWSWGRNVEDQIGDNSNVNQSVPVQIGIGNTWTMVATGSFHSLAVRSDGSLWGWGGNVYGESGGADIPAQIGTDSDWVYVAAGLYFSAAIKSNGTLWMWGSNNYGKLGTGTTFDSSIPVQIGNSHNWISVSLGSQHAIGLRSDGTIWGWGNNDDGELGINNFIDQNLPVQIGTSNDWAKIVVGYSNSYALKNNGTLWAWGFGDFGGIGNGLTTDQKIPVQIGTSTWKTISAVYHVMAIRSDGTLWSWGRNLQGEVGNYTPGTNQLSPVQVGSDNNWTKCAAGFYHSLALKDGGTLWSWGDNQYGTLGKGNFVNSLVPSQTGTICTAPSCTIQTPILPSINVQCSAPFASIAAPTTTDSCGNQLTATLYIGNFPVTAQGTTVIQWKFTNSSGHIIVPQNIVVHDTQLPIPALAQLPNITAQCQVLLSDITTPLANDNCAGQLAGTTTTVFPITSQGSTVITWTYNDGHGNIATQQQTVVITDTQAPLPVVSQLPNITGQCQILLSDITAPLANDNCAGQLTGTTTAVFPITSQGSTVINWTYDDGHGNIATQQQTVVIADTQDPLLQVSQLTNITAQCQVSLSDITAPLANDNCAGQLTGTTTAVFPITTQGSTVITWTYNDGHGNIATQQQTVVITDTQAPVPQVSQLPNITGQCQILLSDITAPMANDNCAGQLTGTTTAVFPITTQGSTVITWTYNDGHGNIATQQQTVVITDTQAPLPVVSQLPNITGQCQVLLSDITTPIANDNCAGQLTGTTTAAFPITSQGITVITWTYNDGHGNIATQQQTVVITDTQAPVPQVSQLPNITGQCQILLSDITAPLANDNCAGQLTGTTTAVFPITTQGGTVITWTYNDGHGNIITQQQTVIIEDTISPLAITQDITVDLEGSNSVLVLPEQINNGSTDNCGISEYGLEPNFFNGPGQYNVTLTVIDFGGNIAYDQAIVTIIDSTMNLIDFTKSNIKLFPVPFTDLLNITANNDLIILGVTIYDTVGREVFKSIENKSSINLSKLSQGGYYIQIVTNQGTYKKSIIKK